MDGDDTTDDTPADEHTHTWVWDDRGFFVCVGCWETDDA